MPESRVGRRKHPRLRLAIDARLITTWGEYRVRLDNLSEAGAHISRPKEERFTRCVLKWLGFEAWGSLVWLRGGYCGIQFDKSVPAQWIEASRAEAQIPDGWKLPVEGRPVRAV